MEAASGTAIGNCNGVKRQPRPNTAEYNRCVRNGGEELSCWLAKQADLAVCTYEYGICLGGCIW